MKLEQFSKRTVLSLGVLAKVCTKPISDSRTECIDVPEQYISNIANSYNLDCILESMKVYAIKTYQEQQKFYDSKYNDMYKNYFVRTYGKLLGMADWYEVNSRIQNCLKFEFLNADNGTWWDVAKKVIRDGNVVVPTSVQIIPRTEIVENIYGVDYLQNKVVYLDKEKYDACAKEKVDSFCKRFYKTDKSLFRRTTYVAVSILAFISGIILGKYTLPCVHGRINSARQGNVINNVNEEGVQNFDVIARIRRRIYSELSDNTLVVSDIGDSVYSDNTLVAEEFEGEIEIIDS